MADDLIPPSIANGGGGSVPVGSVRAPDYRELQQPAQVLQPWRLPNSGAAAHAEALSDAFKQFENAGTSVADLMAPASAAAGRAAGAAAGLAGHGAPKTGLQAATVYGQAYDAAVHQTYVTSSQLALEKQLTDIEAQTTGNPTAFQAQAGAAVQGALKAMDPMYQPELSLWAQNRIQAGVNRQNNQKATDVRNTALATYQSSTPDLITSALHTAAALPGPRGDEVITKLISDDQDRLNALVASRTITPEQAVLLHQRMVDSTHQQMSGQRVDISLQPVLQAMRTNVEAADKLIVQDDPNLTPEENAVRRSEFEKERQQYVQTQTRAHVDALNDAHQRLAAGSYGQGIERTVRGLYQGGALSEEGYFSAMSESLRNQRAALEDEASLTLVDHAVHGQGPPLDPKDPATRDAADKYFQAHVAMSGNVSDPQYGIGAAEFVRQTGIVPKSVQSQIRAGLLSGDPNLTTRAAALAAKIEGVNPEADVYAGSPRLAALAGLVNDNLNAGLQPAQAYAMARTAVDISPEQRKIRDSHYSTDVKTGGGNQAALQETLQKAAGGVFTHAPQAPVAMQAAYESLTRQYYDQTGSIATARQLAGDQLRKTWTISRVNGSPEYMHFGIPDSQVPTVRADIAASVKAAGYAGDPSQIHLTPNSQTTASGGRIWSLTHVDANGDTDVLLDKNNRPLVYHTPSPQDFAKAQQTLATQKINAARAERDQQRKDSVEDNRIERELSNYYLNPSVRYLDPRNRGILGMR